MFHFIRHGKTDYSERNVKIHQGFGVNPAGLSKEGIAQIKETAKR
jgi:broad specificity phosphatase PhoE